MALLASLVIAVLPAVGADTNFYQAESWTAPTMAEITVCADMARDLNDGFDYLIRQGLNKDWQSKTASCEMVIVADAEPAHSRAPAATPAAYRF